MVKPAQRKQVLDGDGEEKIPGEWNPTGLEDRGDFMIRGLWTWGTDCIGNMCVVNVNSLSYADSTPTAILRSNEVRKKRHSLWAFHDQRREFTPVVVSCEGMLGPEANTLLKRIAFKLAEKWHRPYSQVASFVKSKFVIALLRAKSRCLRGSRIKPDRMSHRI